VRRAEGSLEPLMGAKRPTNGELANGVPYLAVHVAALRRREDKMHLRTTMIAMCLLAAAAPALAASQKAHDDCNADDATRNIAGCTRIVNDRHESAKVRAIAYVGRGLAWKQKGNRDQAIADFTDAIRVNPDDALAYNNRAQAWRELGEVDRAIADLTEAIRIDPQPRSDLAGPGFVNAYANRGLAYHAKGDHERALADYNQAIEHDPNDRDARLHRGIILRIQDNHQRAIADFDVAIRARPNDAVAYDLRARSYFEQYMSINPWIKQDDLDQAIADFSQVIRLDPSAAIPYYFRAQAYNTSGDRDRAVADAIQAYRLDPINPGIRGLLKQLKPDYEPPQTSLLQLLK
jgi:tetratricopeptide (TPR) repeat protein